MSADASQVERAFQSAIALHTAGRFGEAAEACRAILQQDPEHARALHLLGLAEKAVGNTERAVELIAQAIALQPQAAEFHNNLGDALQVLGRVDEAGEAFARAIALTPGYFKAYNNLGLLRLHQGRFGEAIEALSQAISLRPDYSRALANLGGTLTQCGSHAEAVECYRRALQLDPHYVTAHSSLLMLLNYAETDPQKVFTAHREWARLHADPLTAQARAMPADRAADRPLRIGYVSGDFCDHAVSSFFRPVLELRNRDAFHVTCYSNLARPDAMTQHLCARADQWRTIAGVPDGRIADMIRGDRIDILVDLAGHSGRNRMLVFARRPAPVQVTWLGYPNTTGMSAIDFRITDALADPVGMTETLHSERLVRLRSNWCYAAPTDAPVSPSPSGTDGRITFGSFNNLAKVNAPMIALWASILRAVPDSRLIVKAAAAGDDAVRRRLLEQFAAHGIDAARLDLRGRVDAHRHLALYGQIDIMLDTFPYHGTTMTCEATWMGVPVITLAGRTHVSRVGVSLLSSVGAEELIAQTSEQYVAIAVELASDPSRLARLRAELRPRMAGSALMDSEAFVRDLEAAFVRMWREAPQASSVPG